MFIFLKNLFKISFIILAVVVFTQSAFADRPNIRDASFKVHLGNQVLSGEIINSSPSQNDSFIRIEGVNINQNFAEDFGNIKWEPGVFGVQVDPQDPSFNSYTDIRFSYFEDGDSGSVGSESFSLPRGALYTYVENTNGTISTQNIPSASDNTQSAVIDFPGWQTAEYRQIDNTNSYYPYISVGVFQRPSDLEVYLILENMITNQREVLETYPAGSQSLQITWPVAPPLTSSLAPGQNYRLFLSETDNIINVVPINSSNQTTIAGLGQVPDNSVLDSSIISNIVATPKQQGEKRYYEITATVIAPNQPPTSSLNFTINKTGETTGQLLGQVPYQSGDIIIPGSNLGNLDSFDPADYFLVITDSVTNQQVQTSIILPQMTSNPGGSEQISNTLIPILSTAQQQIIDTGIAPNCGYNLGDGGRICGFSDLITLVQRAIEYIFILVIPITAIVFAYAGYLYLTSGGNSGKREKAKLAMINVVIGVVVIMSAWLVVTLIVRSLGATDATTQFLDL